MLDNLSSHRDASIDVVPLQATLLSSNRCAADADDGALRRRRIELRLAVDVSRATIDEIVDELVIKVCCLDEFDPLKKNYNDNKLISQLISISIISTSINTKCCCVVRIGAYKRSIYSDSQFLKNKLISS